MDKILFYLQNHWVQIGLIWLAVQNVLKAVQDAIDAMPPNTPILRKITMIMGAVGQYIFTGNRPTAITPPKQ